MRVHRMQRSRSILCVAVLAAISCGRDPIAPPGREFGPAAFAKGAGGKGPTVSATNPQYGEQGTTLDVRVIGTAFGVDAQARWLLHGVANQQQVRTNSTSFVSSTEVVANITIAPDAEIAYWDVEIMTSGKNGIGTEMFEVTTAFVVGEGESRGVNDAGLFVLAGGSVATGPQSYVWTPTSPGAVTGTTASLGAGSAFSIDTAGLVVVGITASDYAGVWTRPTSSSAWSAADQLPNPTGETGSARSITTMADGTQLIYGSLGQQAVAVWQRAADGTWLAPQTFPVPCGMGKEGGIATNGDVAITTTLDCGSQRNALRVGVVLSRAPDGTYYQSATLPPISAGAPASVQHISPDGQIIVGRSNEYAVFWQKDGSGQWAIHSMPTPDGTNGKARPMAVTVAATADGPNVFAIGMFDAQRGVTQALLWSWPIAAGGPSGHMTIGGIGNKQGGWPWAINWSGTRGAGRGGGAGVGWVIR